MEESNAKPTVPAAEVLAKQLKASLTRRRLRQWQIVLPTMVAGMILLALAAWWLYPRPRPAPLQLFALDVVCTPDEVPKARGQLFQPPEDAEPRRLSGYRIIFSEQRLVLPPNQKAREDIDVTSDERGQAAADWPVGQATLTEYLVMYIDLDQRTASPREQGRVFVWPKDAPVLIVDAEETLIADDVDPKASDTLIKAAKAGWRVVYLAVGSPRAHELRMARGWVSKNQPQLPIGPVLGREHFQSDESAVEGRRQALQSLQGRFKGKMLAVVKNADSAQVSKDLGLPTVLIGNAVAPAGVIQVPTWADVVVRLE